MLKVHDTKPKYLNLMPDLIPVSTSPINVISVNQPGISGIFSSSTVRVICHMALSLYLFSQPPIQKKGTNLHEKNPCCSLPPSKIKFWSKINPSFSFVNNSFAPPFFLFQFSHQEGQIVVPSPSCLPSPQDQILFYSSPFIGWKIYMQAADQSLITHTPSVFQGGWSTQMRQIPFLLERFMEQGCHSRKSSCSLAPSSCSTPQLLPQEGVLRNKELQNSS